MFNYFFLGIFNSGIERIFQDCRIKHFWGFSGSICSLLVSTQQIMINLCSRQAQNWNGNYVSGPELRCICQTCVGNHVQHPLIILLNWAKPLHLSTWWTYSGKQKLCQITTKTKHKPTVNDANITRVLKHNRHKTKIKCISFYISFILNYVFHPSSFPCFTQYINAWICKITSVQGQVSSVLESCSQC